ncbi:MAG: sigma-70 family RNA polymerase sigma factor [Chitinophagaceae bacterium]
MQKPITEEDAYIALLSGNERGLDFFFNRYYSPLIFYSNSLTNSHSVAQEITSEAFVKLWKVKETIEDWRKVRFLLYRIVYNASIDFLREQKTLKRNKKDLYYRTEQNEIPSVYKLIEVETYNQLYLLLQNLPPRARQIFRMFYFENKSIKQIAHEIGISVNTVKTQKQRAIKTLRDYQSTLHIIIIFSLIFI